MRIFLPFLAAALCLALACGGDDTGTPDSSTPDSSAPDGALPDGSTPDAGMAPARIEQYLRGDAASRLFFEVDYFPGYEPDDAVRDAFLDATREVVDKPDGVEFRLDDTLEARDTPWTLADLQALAAETSSIAEGDGEVSIHLLFVDGLYEQESVLGLAFGDRDMAVFRDRFEEMCDSAALPLMRDQLCQSAEITILVHELGHILGLVNRGLPMVVDHEDPEHPRHEADSGCVMYWALAGPSAFDSILTRFVGGDTEPLSFCAASLADMAAVRDR